MKPRIQESISFEKLDSVLQTVLSGDTNQIENLIVTDPQYSNVVVLVDQVSSKLFNTATYKLSSNLQPTYVYFPAGRLTIFAVLAEKVVVAKLLGARFGAVESIAISLSKYGSCVVDEIYCVKSKENYLNLFTAIIRGDNYFLCETHRKGQITHIVNTEYGRVFREDSDIYLVSKHGIRSLQNPTSRTDTIDETDLFENIQRKVYRKEMVNGKVELSPPALTPVRFQGLCRTALLEETSSSTGRYAHFRR